MDASAELPRPIADVDLQAETELDVGSPLTLPASSRPLADRAS